MYTGDEKGGIVAYNMEPVLNNYDFDVHSTKKYNSVTDIQVIMRHMWKQRDHTEGICHLKYCK